MSTVAKPHHRIWRLEGTFKVEESTSSLLIASQPEAVQLLLMNFQWVQLSELWGLIDKGEDLSGYPLLGKHKMVLPEGCLVTFVSMVAKTALSKRLELLASVSFCCLILPQLHGLQIIAWVSVVDLRWPEIIWCSSLQKWSLCPLPLSRAGLCDCCD